MSEPHNPGQIAYEAYSANIANPYSYAWEKLGPYEQRAWDAAARAVLARTPPGDTPVCMHFGPAMHATHGLCGVASPWVALLPRLVTCQACIALMQPHARTEVPRG